MQLWVIAPPEQSSRLCARVRELSTAILPRAGASEEAGAVHLDGGGDDGTEGARAWGVEMTKRIIVRMTGLVAPIENGLVAA